MLPANIFGIIPGAGLLAAALEAIPGTPKSGTIRVNHENILKAATIIQNQVDQLSVSFKDRRKDLIVQAAGADSVSQYAAISWNTNLVLSNDSYAIRVEQYIESLHKVLKQMRDAAVQYGFTEDEITRTFRAPA